MVAIPIRPVLDPRRASHSPTPKPDGHIAALDGIRGLAILMVTIYRFNGGLEAGGATDNILIKAATLGYRGVDLFFVLSGYLITSILLDSKDQPHYFRNFYARRALRIFPLYYGVLLLVLVLLPAISTTVALTFRDARENQAWLWLYGINVLQARLGAWPFGSLDHFWSLAVEEHFYFVWPLMIYLTSRRGAIAACIILILSALTLRVTWLAAGGNDIAPEVFTLFRMDSLAMGALTALLVKSKGRAVTFSGPARSGAWALGLILIVVTVLNRRFATVPDTFFAAFFACVLVLAVSAPRQSIFGSLWNSSALRFFGKYSYGMYVFQYPMIPLLAPLLTIDSLAMMLGNTAAARLLYITLMTAITTAAAVASWHLFEKHFLRLKRLFPTGVQQKPHSC